MNRFRLPTILLLILPLCLFALAGPVFAGEPEGGRSKTLELTLDETLRLALRQNLALKRESLSVSAAAAQVLAAKGEFDPTAGLSLSQGYAKRSLSSTLEGTMSRRYDASLTFGGKLDTGTRYDLTWQNERVKSDLAFLLVNPYYSSDFTLVLTQPLLKGRGRAAQRAMVDIASGDFDISGFNERTRAEAIVLEAARGYWELYFRIYDRQVAELSLGLAEAILAEVKEKIAVGYLAPVEQYEAEAELYSRREGLVVAEKAMRDAEDSLRVLLNLGDWEAAITPAEAPPPAEKTEPGPPDALPPVLDKRWDYKAALTALKTSEVRSRLYGNQVLPELDIFAATGLNGVAGSYGDALDKVGSGDFYSWEVGFTVSVPIGNRTARGNYRKAKFEEQKAQVALRETEQGIMFELKEARRAVQAAYDRVEATASKRVAAQKRFEAEKERFTVGLAALNDVFRLEVDYSRSLSDEKGAQVDYALALINRERVKGELLERFLPAQP